MESKKGGFVDGSPCPRDYFQVPGVVFRGKKHPGTDIKHLKIVFQSPLFRGFPVSFRECIHLGTLPFLNPNIEVCLDVLMFIWVR